VREIKHFNENTMNKQRTRTAVVNENIGLMYMLPSRPHKNGLDVV